MLLVTRYQNNTAMFIWSGCIPLREDFVCHLNPPCKVFRQSLKFGFIPRVCVKLRNVYSVSCKSFEIDNPLTYFDAVVYVSTSCNQNKITLRIICRNIMHFIDIISNVSIFVHILYLNFKPRHKTILFEYDFFVYLQVLARKYNSKNDRSANLIFWV